MDDIYIIYSFKTHCLSFFSEGKSSHKARPDSGLMESFDLWRCQRSKFLEEGERFRASRGGAGESGAEQVKGFSRPEHGKHSAHRFCLLPSPPC